jgi:hypothetical protein
MGFCIMKRAKGRQSGAGTSKNFSASLDKMLACLNHGVGVASAAYMQAPNYFDAAARRVPLHLLLVKRGLLDYAKAAAKLPGGRLFPRASTVSKAFTRYRRSRRTGGRACGDFEAFWFRRGLMAKSI